MHTFEDAEVEYDEEADAWYIDLDPSERFREVDKSHPRTAYMDYDADGNLVGIEII